MDQWFVTLQFQIERAEDRKLTLQEYAKQLGHGVIQILIHLHGLCDGLCGSA